MALVLDVGTSALRAGLARRVLPQEGNSKADDDDTSRSSVSSSTRREENFLKVPQGAFHKEAADPIVVCRPLVHIRRGKRQEMQVADLEPPELNPLPVDDVDPSLRTLYGLVEGESKTRRKVPIFALRPIVPDSVGIWQANARRVDSLFDFAGTSFGTGPGSGSNDSGLSSSNYSDGLGGGSSATVLQTNLISSNLPHTVVSAYERGLPVGLDTHELVLDSVLTRLGVGNGNGIDNPVVMTEALCTPSLMRKYTCELMFEGYGAPSLCLGVDSLFSLFGEGILRPSTKSLQLRENATILSVGATTSHLLPIVAGVPLISEARRIDVGGDHTLGYFQRIALAKWPDMMSLLSYDRLEEMALTHCYVSPESYREEINRAVPKNSRLGPGATVRTIEGESLPKHPRLDPSLDDPLVLNPDLMVTLQIPFVVHQPEQLSSAERAEKERLRMERAQRLQQMLEERRVRKQAENEAKLADFERVLSTRPAELSVETAETDLAPYLEALIDRDLAKEGDVDDDKFMREYFKLKVTVLKGRRTSEAAAAASAVHEEERLWNEGVAKTRFALVDLPDDDPRLRTKRMQALKKKQVAMKAMYDGQQRVRAATEAKKREEEARDAKEEATFRDAPDSCLFQWRSKRVKIMEERHRREKMMNRRLGSKSRHTFAKMQRMQILAQLAIGDEDIDSESKAKARHARKRKTSETWNADDDDEGFGDDEDGWNAYKLVQKEKSAVLTDAGELDTSLLSTEEREESAALEDICRLLARFDPDYEPDASLETVQRAARTARSFLEAEDSVARQAAEEEEDALRVKREQRTALSDLRLSHEWSAHPSAEDYQVSLCVERFRVPEMLFTPSIAGISDLGVCDGIPHIYSVLRNRTSVGTAASVVGNIFLTGGASSYRNFDTRVSNEVRGVLPIDTPVFVRRATFPAWNAFCGASHWAHSAVLDGTLARLSLRRDTWNECGPDYLAEHPFASNVGFPLNMRYL